MTRRDALRLYPSAVIAAAFASHGHYSTTTGWTVPAAALARLEPSK